MYAPVPRLREFSGVCQSIGTPILRLEVDSEGRIAKLEFLRGSGCKPADQKLRHCLGYWRFEPATCNGGAMSEVMTLTINWHPEERDGGDPCRPQEECREEPAQEADGAADKVVGLDSDRP
jgi:TonB family protein